MYNMQRGRGRWRSGADTCVFKPAVKCLGDEKRPEPNQYISRVVSKNSDDIKIEEILRTRFNLLHTYKLISTSERSCIPEYEQSDKFNSADGFTARGQGCQLLGIDGQGNVGNPKDQTNLITRIVGKNVDEFLVETGIQQNLAKKISGLSHTLVASILLVPDEGPWVVNEDLHFGNILTFVSHSDVNPSFQLSNGWELKRNIVRNQIYSTISDWGRVIYIENPNDTTNTISGIRRWGQRIFAGDPNQVRLAGNQGYSQHPPELMELLAHGLESANKNIASVRALNAIRGSMVYVILYQCLIGHYPVEQINRGLRPLLQTTNQETLVKTLNTVLASIIPGSVFTKIINQNTIQVAGFTSFDDRRLLSVPKRKGQRSSSSSKKHYTRRRRALRSGKGGYRATRTGRKV
jgi:hypothetical protein